MGGKKKEFWGDRKKEKQGEEKKEFFGALKRFDSVPGDSMVHPVWSCCAGELGLQDVFEAQCAILGTC